MKNCVGLGALALVFMGLCGGCGYKPAEETPAAPEAAKANEEPMRREKRGY